MKALNIIKLLSFTFISITFVCCSNDSFSEDRPEKGYFASLTFSGEITTANSPLTRGAEQDDLYCIQAYQDGEAYAHGLFNYSNIPYTIYLHAGHKYKFVTTVVKNGENLLYKTTEKVDDYETYLGYFISGQTFRKSDGFVYNTTDHNLGKGECRVTTENSYEKTDYPQIDRFYGETDNIIATDYNTSVNINLKRTSFGIQYEANGITDGVLQITIKAYDGTLLFSNQNITSDYSSEEKIFSFSDVYSSWLYANNYTEAVTISAKWIRDVGIAQDLGSKNVQVKRNAMNIIRLQLSSDNGDNMIGIDVEEDNNMNEENIEVSLTK